MSNSISSIWDNDYKNKNFKQLENDISTDVLIIGGGITGILTAYSLHQKGINYILVEKERICRGVTHNTTAKITSQHNLIYQDLLSQYGAEKAKMYYDINQKAIETYSELSKKIDCDFERKDNYVYSTDNRAIIEKELEALDKIGCDFEYCKDLEIPVKTVGAVKFPNQAQFNPIKLLLAISSNLNIYENTFVTAINGNTAITDRAKIKAEKIIVATHFPFLNKRGSYPLKLYQHRSYVLALQNAQKLNGMYLDENEKGLSFRNYNGYMFLGGGSHRTGKHGGKWEELRRKAKEFYPDSIEKFHWATQDCMSLDKIAYIGNYSKNTPELFVASGFNKWGMTTAIVASEILSDLVCERENEYAEIFSPSRSIIKPQLLINGAEAIKNLLTPTTKRCTHLGCALKWNNAEHTWDCPCHGSRFTDDGRVIDNPAKKNL